MLITRNIWLLLKPRKIVYLLTSLTLLTAYSVAPAITRASPTLGLLPPTSHNSAYNIRKPLKKHMQDNLPLPNYIWLKEFNKQNQDNWKKAILDQTYVVYLLDHLHEHLKKQPWLAQQHKPPHQLSSRIYILFLRKAK